MNIPWSQPCVIKAQVLAISLEQYLKMVIRKSSIRNYIQPKAPSEAQLSGVLSELNLLQGADVYSGQMDLFSSITACSLNSSAILLIVQVMLWNTGKILC